MVRQATLMRIAVLFILFCANFAHAVKPETVFRVMETDHFEVIYQQGQLELAKRYAIAAEQAYQLLTPIFSEAPEKTIVFINDETDLTNGSANFLPYPLITVYPILPSTLDSIDDYGDWPLEMMIHEYTHILNMYPAHGFYVPFKYVFGSVVRPNAILPKWYLEGLAVNMESHLSDHGRLRTTETSATARALVLGGNFERENIAVINEQELTTWPYGNRPYLFGGWWWNHVQSEHGPKVIETWNQNFSRRLPFLLNGPMADQTGKDAEDLLAATYEGLTAQAETQLKDLRAARLHNSEPVTNETGEQSIFAISPSAEKLVYFISHPLVYLASQALVGTEVKLKTRTFPTEPFRDVPSKTLFKTMGSLRVRWIDDTHLIFDQLDVSAPHVTYRDLYTYDFASEKVQRLTQGLRAQEPAPSPKGDQVAFIQNDAGRNNLALLPLGPAPTSAPPRILARGNFRQRLSGPEFINDNEIVFVMRIRSGAERLYVYNLHDHSLKRWNSHLQSAQNPRFTAKGLLVSDDSTYVRNIYLAKSEDDEPQAVTNTLTHIESADYDPKRNELLFSEMTSQGNRLQTIPFAKFNPETLDPPKIDAPPLPTLTKLKYSDSSYQPLSYLLPRYWIPFIYNVENGGWLLQGSTSNSDPAGRNRYSIMGSIDTITNKPSYGVNYVNSSLPTDIGLGYAKSISYLGASNLTFESQSASLDFATYWPFNNRFTKWHLGGVWDETIGANVNRRIGPDTGLSYARTQNPNSIWAGVVAEAYHQEFVQERNYLAYGRSYAHLAGTLPVFGTQKIFLQARAALAPRLPESAIVELGDRNVGANYLVSLVNSDFLLRGYPSGAFVGRKIINANLEYSLPVAEIAKGYGTFPLFLKAMELALFVDTMAVDGGGFKPDLGHYYVSKLSQYYTGTGAELRLATTAAYQLPVSFTLGAYYGLNQQYGGGFTPFLGLGLGDLGAVQNKTP